MVNYSWCLLHGVYFFLEIFILYMILRTKMKETKKKQKHHHQQQQQRQPYRYLDNRERDIDRKIMSCTFSGSERYIDDFFF